jgi:hypothetical protein
MWTCAKCGESLGDNFDTCWKCGTSKHGAEDPAFAKRAAVMQEQVQKHPLICPRCEQSLSYVGTRAFHEGTNWGVLGEFGELFVKKDKFDVYCCPRCGRVEFFVDGIGAEFRPR